MAKISAMVFMDVEDPITPRSHEAARWMCEELTAAGVTGTCFVVAEKARDWERRGLREVIEAVKRHDVNFHGWRHSFHPTVSEISEQLAGEWGAEQLWNWQRPAWDDAERIMGTPLLHWCTSGGSWSPSLARMLGRHGRSLFDSPIRGEDAYRPCWFAGGLNFAHYVGYLDGAYRDDEAFPGALAEYQRKTDELVAAGAPYLCFFGGHPTAVVHEGFWDAVNFAKGKATTPENYTSPPAIDGPAELTAQKNFAAYAQWLATDERFEMIGASEMARLFGGQRPGASRQYVRGMVGRILDEECVIWTDEFTAAEALALMVDFVLDPEADPIPRRDIMGPTEPMKKAFVGKIPASEVIRAAEVVNAHMTVSGALPSTVRIAGEELYIAQYFVALAQAIAGIDGELEIEERAEYPAIGDRIVEDISRRIERWIIHREHMDLSWIERETRLLSWTFKPAWTHAELSQPVC